MDRVTDEIAHALQADLDARGVRRLFADGRGPDSVSEAYALQRALRRVRETRGERVIGLKIGFTSPTVRRDAGPVMGLEESVHGYLWDSESHESGATVDHRRLGIEGELGVTVLKSNGTDVAEWEVAYEPIIELHAMGMDGPPADNQGRRGLELIATNCVHAGVVHCAEQKRCRLGEVPLGAIMKVTIGGSEIERVTLTALEIDGVYGPAGTVGWLRRKLIAEGNGEEAILGEGAQLLCSTPGGLYPVRQGQEVVVDFDGLTTTCSATS